MHISSLIAVPFTQHDSEAKYDELKETQSRDVAFPILALRKTKIAWNQRKQLIKHKSWAFICEKQSTFFLRYYDKILIHNHIWEGGTKQYCFLHSLAQLEVFHERSNWGKNQIVWVEYNSATNIWLVLCLS